MRSLILYQVNGQAEQLVDWNQVNWVTDNKLIRNLQRRIFRAMKTWSVEATREGCRNCCYEVTQTY